MARAGVPLVTVVFVMAVLVSRNFALHMLVGDINRIRFVMASLAQITAFRGWKYVSEMMLAYADNCRTWTHSASIPGHKQLDTRRRRQPVCTFLDKLVSSCLYVKRKLKSHTIANLTRAARLRVSVRVCIIHIVLCVIPDGFVAFAPAARRHCIG